MTDLPDRPRQSPPSDTLSESEIVQGFMSIGRFFQGLMMFVRRFLDEQRPSIIFFTAFIVLILTAILAQLAIYAIPGMEGGIRRSALNSQSMSQSITIKSTPLVSLILAVSYYIKIAALMLAVWALIRLLADAIRDGAKS